MDFFSPARPVVPPFEIEQSVPFRIPALQLPPKLTGMQGEVETV